MSKNGSRRCITLVCLPDFRSNHEIDITVEFTSKNGFQRCITLVCFPNLPYMVTLIMKLSPLNSCQKMVPEDVSHLCASLAIYGHYEHEMDKQTLPIEDPFRTHTIVPFYKLDDILHI